MAQDLPMLDDEIVRMPADIRMDLAERGRRDLFFFAKAVMGYREMTPSCHGPLCAFHDKNPSRMKLTLMPRGHFKTSVCTIGKNTQQVCRDPNARVLLINETMGNAENFLSAIEQNFQSNRVLRALYSDIIPNNFRTVPWNSQEMRLVRTWSGPEETITAMGMTSAHTSRHYTHISVDDPISEEAVKSDLVMQDAINRISKFLSLMVNPDRDTFDLTGTRWALHDVYSYFMKKLGPQLARFIRAAIKDGQPIFPELISLETLATAREIYQEYGFSCLYMNNPRDTANQDFNVQDLRFWRWSTDESCVVLYGSDGEIDEIVPMHKLDITVSVDLAVSEKITSDRNAVVTCGTTPSGKAVVLDVWAQRCTPLEVINQLFTLRKRFAVRQWGIEGVAYQKAFKYFLKAECERQQVYMNVVELKAIPSKRNTGNNSKQMRIRGLQPIAATGRLYIHPNQHLLRNEMADFPLGEHDDCIDALAHQLTMWRGFLSPERMLKYKASEQRLIARAQSGWLPGGEFDDWMARRPELQATDDDLGIDPDQHRFGQFEDWVMEAAQ